MTGREPISGAVYSITPDGIKKVCTRVAYPRNGNVDNPTVYWHWRTADGCTFQTLREARAYLRAWTES